MKVARLFIVKLIIKAVDKYKQLYYNLAINVDFCCNSLTIFRKSVLKHFNVLLSKALQEIYY